MSRPLDRDNDSEPLVRSRVCPLCGEPLFVLVASCECGYGALRARGAAPGPAAQDPAPPVIRAGMSKADMRMAEGNRRASEARRAVEAIEAEPWINPARVARITGMTNDRARAACLAATLSGHLRKRPNGQRHLYAVVE